MSDNIFMKKFSEDEVIIREGETYEEMYKIVSGRAALYLQYGTENEYLIGVLSDGKCFGEVSVLTGKPSPYSVVAIISKERTKGGLNKRATFGAPYSAHFWFFRIEQSRVRIWGFNTSLCHCLADMRNTIQTENHVFFENWAYFPLTPVL